MHNFKSKIEIDLSSVQMGKIKLISLTVNKLNHEDYIIIILPNINYSKDNFANWTSGNGKLLDCLIQDLIQEMQSEINSFYDAIFE
ncbi:hypothetical protein RhiirA5_417549 [Rhizophagus irregularis]|uniref:Uncharacterized protein n=1 Tax=Rhizophagus irregularis TaxID=588596 RepID=A0A2N0PMA7_9GLOM|nr:hypothetical protein RhiirA5_417549 [Rhizophagus irregularis]